LITLFTPLPPAPAPDAPDYAILAAIYCHYFRRYFIILMIISYADFRHAMPHDIPQAAIIDEPPLLMLRARNIFRFRFHERYADIAAITLFRH